MAFSSSSDEDDSFLGTNKLTNLHAKFTTFYQTKKLDYSDDEDIQPIAKYQIISPNKRSLKETIAITIPDKKDSPSKNTRSNRLKKPLKDNASLRLRLAISSDDQPIFAILPSNAVACTINNDIIVNDTPNKSVDADDVLRRLDQLAETAKELSEDYGAALYGKSRKKCKIRKTVTPDFINTDKGTKTSRTTRNSARLARLQIRQQVEESEIIQSSSTQHYINQNEVIELIDSDNASGNSSKRLKRAKKKDLNPTVQCNINWRCDSEVTHKIAVFKFQCLSCIEEFCCSEYSIDQRLILFTIDDKPVDLKEHCYASLKLSESSVIDGGVLPDSYLHIGRPKVVQEVGLMRLKVQYLANGKTRDFPVRVKKDDGFEIIFWLIIKALDCDFEDILLFCDGSQVKISDTVSSLDLEENDCLDLTLSSSRRS